MYCFVLPVFLGQLFPAYRCVIGELFLDGKPMFDLSQLLRYSSGEKEFSENTLKRISDKFIRVRGGEGQQSRMNIIIVARELH